MLKVRDLCVSYGNAEVLRSISFQVDAGGLVALVGANGAGKTTTLRTISGLVKPTSGSIEFEGRRINGEPPDVNVRLGIAHCPEGRRVFPALTVSENLELGAYIRRKELKKNLDYCYRMFPILRERRKQLAGTLSGGEQQMLAIARTLMSRPKLILFDEPSLGLAPTIVEKVANIVMNINYDGTTVLLVEQNAFLALSMAHYAYVLETGRMDLSGKAEVMLENEHVKRAYLGY